MSDSDFELFDEMRRRTDNVMVVVECQHETVDNDGVCEDCFVILHQRKEAEFNSHNRASASLTSKHDRVNHFMKILNRSDLSGGEFSLVLGDFEKFNQAFNSIPRDKRKNFLLNRLVLWKLAERRDVPCERYKIKGVKSEEEHERLLTLVFEKLGWRKS